MSGSRDVAEGGRKLTTKRPAAKDDWLGNVLHVVCRSEMLGLRYNLGGGFKYLLFKPLFGEDSHFDQYFSNGLKPPTSNVTSFFL